MMSVKVVIPTIKTNSHKTVELEKCTEWMEQHLKKSSAKSSKDKIDTIFESAINPLDELKINDAINDNECQFLKENNGIKSCPCTKTTN